MAKDQESGVAEIKVGKGRHALTITAPSVILTAALALLVPGKVREMRHASAGQQPQTQSSPDTDSKGNRQLIEHGPVIDRLREDDQSMREAIRDLTMLRQADREEVVTLKSDVRHIKETMDSTAGKVDKAVGLLEQHVNQPKP